jgi:hypothetical protein
MEINNGAIIAAIIAVASAIVWKIIRSRRDNRKKPIVFPPNAGEISTLELHEWDINCLRFSAVSTITFFDYSSAHEISSVESYFRTKVIAMIEANPWLRGRLGRESKTKLVLRYPKAWDQANLQEHFDVCVDAKINLSMRYRDAVDCFKKAIILDGNDAVDNDVPLFKISIFKFPDEKKYALVLSVCHAIVDGRTYYLLYSMLDKNTAPYPLDAVRVQRFPSDLKARLNTSKFTANPLFAIRFLAYMLFTPKKPTNTMRYVNMGEIERRKAAYVAQNPGKYITTNDILVSWFAKTVHLDYLFVAMNFRNRIPCVIGNVAGNYSGALTLTNEFIATPESVHTAVSQALTGKDPVPSVWKLINFRAGLSTNWSTFYTEIEVPGSEHIKHLPLFAIGNARLPAAMIIFAPKKGHIGVMCAANEPAGPRFDFIGGDSPLGPEVMGL